MNRLPFDLPIPSGPWTTCSACGARVLPGECPECRTRRMVAAERLARARACGFPERFDWIDRSLPTWPNDAAKRITIPAWFKGSVDELISRIVADPRPIVTFVGPAGRGKTSLAVACARAAFASPVFASAEELEALSKLTSLGSEEPVGARARDRRFVVLDDMGKEQGTKLSPIPGIIQARHHHHRKTFVTTGLKSDQVLSRYDEGVHRRLFEKASAMVIHWPWT